MVVCWPVEEMTMNSKFGPLPEASDSLNLLQNLFSREYLFSCWFFFLTKIFIFSKIQFVWIYLLYLFISLYELIHFTIFTNVSVAFCFSNGRTCGQHVWLGLVGQWWEICTVHEFYNCMALLSCLSEILGKVKRWNTSKGITQWMNIVLYCIWIFDLANACKHFSWVLRRHCIITLLLLFHNLCKAKVNQVDGCGNFQGCYFIATTKS